MQYDQGQQGGRDDTATIEIYGVVMSLLEQYDDIFSEPNILPPHRKHNQRINLEEGVKGLSLRPYRHCSTQKDVIENMIQELLQKGVIQPSTSLFSSPVVLVKKNNNIWKMCVDYRELNDKTIKFPIPVIEESLDELCGISWFIKLDLR